jgi:hypothetical protein
MNCIKVVRDTDDNKCKIVYDRNIKVLDIGVGTDDTTDKFPIYR